MEGFGFPSAKTGHSGSASGGNGPGPWLHIRSSMKMRLDFKAAIILFLLSCAASTAAKADDEMTAGGLYSFCTSADQVASTTCRFYIVGVVQGIGLGDGTFMDATRKMAERKKTIFCMPENTPQAQMVSIVTDTCGNFSLPIPTTRNCPPSCQFWPR